MEGDLKNTRGNSFVCRDQVKRFFRLPAISGQTGSGTMLASPNASMSVRGKLARPSPSA